MTMELNLPARAGFPGLVLCAAALAMAVGCAKEPAAAPQTEEASSVLTVVRTELPSVETVTDSTILSAEVLPKRRATLAAEVGGVVEKLTFNEGERVARGKTLARIDTRAIEQRVAEAEAMARQADSSFTTAKRLLEQRAITNSQMLDALTAHDVAKARLEGARLQLSKSTLEAPWRGRISRKLVEVGDFVGPGQPIAVLIEDQTLEVRASASASDVGFLEVGLPVEVRIDGVDQVYEAKIARLGSELDSESRSLAFEVDLANDGRLRPGMVARLTLPRRTIEGAVLVPLAALVEMGEDKAVYVIHDGRAERREVTLGPVMGERVVILSGIDGGDHVVVEGRLQVAPGQVVNERFDGDSLDPGNGTERTDGNAAP